MTTDPRPVPAEGPATEPTSVLPGDVVLEPAPASAGAATARDTLQAAGALRVPVLNLANALTVLRLVLVPVLVWLVVASEMTHPGWRTAACVAFCVASLTDFADGWLARNWNLITVFGQVADPIADKALTGAALVLLSAYDRLSGWITALILARELGVTVIRFWVLRYGVIPASRGGKVKTTLQIVAIAWYIAPFPAPVSGLGPWIMAVAVVVTMVTGLDYVWRAFKLRRRALRRIGAQVD